MLDSLLYPYSKNTKKNSFQAKQEPTPSKGSAGGSQNGYSRPMNFLSFDAYLGICSYIYIILIYRIYKYGPM